MNIIDGKLVSNNIKEALKKQIELKKRKYGLAIIQIANDEASNVYIKQKEKLCNELNINFYHVKFDINESQINIETKIKELNDNLDIDGIIIQLPIPKEFDKKCLVNLINPLKDIDGLTDMNKIKLINNEPCLIPCTPLGIVELLKYYNIDVSGKNVVIVGRSDLVSKPLFNLLLNMDATVTICHSKTNNLKEFTKNADILISATGKKHLIQQNMVKENSVIIDVGITRENGILYGDVDFENVKNKVSYITPVPGGVGPMTVIMLIKNLINKTSL